MIKEIQPFLILISLIFLTFVIYSYHQNNQSYFRNCNEIFIPDFINHNHDKDYYLPIKDIDNNNNNNNNNQMINNYLYNEYDYIFNDNINVRSDKKLSIIF
jgi:hypothetical protein